MYDVQVLTAVEEFAVVRDKLQELGQQIDHDHSGPVYTPLTHVEVPSTCLLCLCAHCGNACVIGSLLYVAKATIN